MSLISKVVLEWRFFSWDWTLGPNLRGWFNQSVGTCHILPVDIGKCSHFGDFFPTLHLQRMANPPVSGIPSQRCESGAISEFYQLWPLKKGLTV
jgi:hypothetical protein